jgi:hypothetical protein
MKAKWVYREIAKQKQIQAQFSPNLFSAKSNSKDRCLLKISEAFIPTHSFQSRKQIDKHLLEIFPQKQTSTAFY